MPRAVITVDARSFDIRDFIVEESCGKHDLLTVRGNALDIFDYPEKPAKLSIDHGAQVREIVGYLDTPAMQTGTMVDFTATGFMLGASSIMRSGAPRVWEGARPFDIARDIVRPYGFCLEMDRFDTRLSFFSQSTESDWVALARLALECGMELVGTNTVIRIVDPVNEIRRRYNRPFSVINVNKLRKYSVSQSKSPIGYERRKFVGVDKYGQTINVTANEDSSISLGAPERVASLGDALAAKTRVEGRRSSLRRANTTLGFHPAVRSGMTIGLTNGVDTTIWFVLEATHTSTMEDSSTTLVLCRDDDERKVALDSRNPNQWPTPGLLRDRWVGSVRWEREL